MGAHAGERRPNKDSNNGLEPINGDTAGLKIKTSLQQRKRISHANPRQGEIELTSKQLLQNTSGLPRGRLEKPISSGSERPLVRTRDVLSS